MVTKVLDKGFVRLVDSMGNDASIVQAARVSYGPGTKTPSSDESLIRYLMRHEHTSPFEMVELKFHVKCPIFIARQWVRHRTASINEISGRYSFIEEEFYCPEATVIFQQSESAKQCGTETLVEHPEGCAESLNEICKEAFNYYEGILEEGVRRELARIILPLATYTEFYWKIDLHNLFRFMKLRSSDKAQLEMQSYAKAIMELTQPIVPIAFKAFVDYQLNAIKLSAQELDIIRSLLNIVELHRVADDLELGDSEKKELLKKLF